MPSLDLSGAAPRRWRRRRIGLIFSAQTSWSSTSLYWTTRPDYQVFFKALPILGKDGTLAKIQTSFPRAPAMSLQKPAPFGSDDKLGGKMMLNGKASPATSSPKMERGLAFRRLRLITSRSLLTGGRGNSKWLGQSPRKKMLQPPMTANSGRSQRSAGGLTDLIIRNAHIIDGTGNPLYARDVAVSGARLAASAICREGPMPARNRCQGPHIRRTRPSLTCSGQPKKPLSIDKSLPQAKLSQGITHENKHWRRRPIARKMNEKDHRASKAVSRPLQNSASMDHPRRLFPPPRKAKHHRSTSAPYVGSAQIREAVIGDDNRAPTPSELIHDEISASSKP